MKKIIIKSDDSPEALKIIKALADALSRLYEHLTASCGSCSECSWAYNDEGGSLTCHIKEVQATCESAIDFAEEYKNKDKAKWDRVKATGILE